MSVVYTVPLKEVIREFQLEEIFLPEGSDTLVSRSDLNRPGLALAGFFGHFDPERIQLIGRCEHTYLTPFDHEEKRSHIMGFMSQKPVAVIITSSLEVFPEFLEAAKKYSVPLLRTEQRTSEFMASLISYLRVCLAQRITRHGVLVEVYSEGMLLLGDSGIGKSETAIELVKRGHRLIADDAVEIKKVSSKTLVGSAPEVIRHYIELRGIGVVDVRRLFGVGAVKDTEKIDLVVNLEPWVQGKMYDRLGLDNEFTDIMGINIPTITIPVKPGRNLAIILEIAAMNSRQKKMGHNTAKELERNLLHQMGADSDADKADF